jgi:hypothetical protein
VSNMDDVDDNDELSVDERRALALWRVPEPPADLAERVLARGAVASAGLPTLRGLAVAAVVLVVVGGILGMRSLMRPPAPLLETSGVYRPDAGPRPEVRLPSDGTDLEPS